MPCLGIVIRPGRGLILGSDCLTPVTAELLPAALEICDIGQQESLEASPTLQVHKDLLPNRNNLACTYMAVLK